MGVLTDLKILWRESQYLPYIGTTNKEDSSGKYDEFNLLNSIPSALRLVLGALTGIGSWSKKPQIVKIGDLNKEKERWYFINGIFTDLTVLTLNTTYLSEIFGTQIAAMWNPNRGIIPDLIECATGRTLDRNEIFTSSYGTLIENSLQSGYEVKLIAHSQGGIVVSNIIKFMSEKRMDFSNLEIYTFASAADGEQKRTGLFQEHFGNDEDFVYRIGLGAPEYKPEIMWRRNAGKGHLLNIHYLNAFKDGRLCGKKSKLYSHVVK